MNAAPAVANECLKSIHLEGGRGELIKSVTQDMAPGNQFYGIDKCDVESYRAAVVTFVKAPVRTLTMAENGAAPALDILICVQGVALIGQVCRPRYDSQLHRTLICRIES